MHLGHFCVFKESSIVICDMGKLEILKYIINYSKELIKKDDSFKLNLFTIAKKLKNTIAMLHNALLEQRITIV